MVQAADFAKTLQLTVLSPSTQTEWDIRTTDLNRPGMQFCGFYEYFPFERPQVIGKVEMTYLENLEPEVRRQMLKKYFSFDIPCVIICRGMHPPEELLEAAAARNIAVYQTGMVTTKFFFTAINYLNRCLAPRVTRHGVLVSVYGMGVLITGDSGVGKSEAALELIRRGHQLVADDVVDICRVSDNRLTGECPEMVPLHGDSRHRHHRHPRDVRHRRRRAEQVHRPCDSHGEVGRGQGVRPAWAE